MVGREVQKLGEARDICKVLKKINLIVNVRNSNRFPTFKTVFDMNSSCKTCVHSLKLTFLCSLLYKAEFIQCVPLDSDCEFPCQEKKKIRQSKEAKQELVLKWRSNLTYEMIKQMHRAVEQRKTT